MLKIHGRALNYCLIVASLCVTTVHSADQLPAYLGAPPEITIAAHEQAILKSGQAIYRAITRGSTRHGIAVFGVDADSKIIWSVIRDFESYPLWIDALTDTKIYNREADLIYVKFTARHWLAGNTSWYVIHNYPSTQSWGTWQLDSSRNSDLAESVGFWRVLPVPNQPRRSNVVYSVDLRMKGFFAGLFEKSLIENSLESATSWVKIQSQLRN